MTETSKFSLEYQFNSLNGGISMCIPRFSDSLVSHGLDEFYRFAHDKLEHSPCSKTREDWHFLRSGVEGLGSERLAAMIASLKAPRTQLETLSEEYRCCTTSIGKTEEQWHAASETARQQLAFWEEWAIEAEIKWQKNAFPWADVFGGDVLLRFSVLHDLGDTSGALVSSQRLQKNLDFFKKKVGVIQAKIASAYLASELPEGRSPYKFEMALKELLNVQKKIQMLENEKAEIAKKQECAWEMYRTNKKPLVDLLFQLPLTAQWALFIICREEFREHSYVEQSVGQASRN